jgi:hypothetical protein
MLMSVDVPTNGLPKIDAQRYAQFLRFVAVQGQSPGLSNGQLPPGFLPMTAANGLASLARYTQAAASAVAAQAGGRTSVTTFKTATGGNGSNGGGGSYSPTPVTAPPAVPQTASGPTARGPSNTTSGAAPIVAARAPSGSTLGLGSGLAGLAFPLALVLAVVGSIAGALTWFLGRPRTSR